MTTPRPNAAELLTIARQELLDTVLPEVDESLKYQILMIANAMKIANRELTDDHSTDHEAQSALDQFYQTHAPQRAEAACEQQLADDLRQRRFDDDDSVHRLLLTLTEHKLNLSNPKYLGKR
ncbi:DUF6285 domain-containing protein [Marinobacter caseinilyticus]|uniref:DUF6285 domain-containing protein n=1 Tax=Marinobacter caseinilyticus TaxID=2692195 RepID=UPI00140CE76C|nr:DUF6285 domain-containing protein [Marinobacter caseinilyticus]